MKCLNQSKHTRSLIQQQIVIKQGIQNLDILGFAPIADIGNDRMPTVQNFEFGGPPIGLDPGRVPHSLGLTLKSTPEICARHTLRSRV